jgi:hypothetical protein
MAFDFVSLAIDFGVRRKRAGKVEFRVRDGSNMSLPLGAFILPRLTLTHSDSSQYS